MLPLLPTTSRYPHPDWKTLYGEVAARGFKGAELEAFWNARGREWVDALCAAFGTDYHCFESDGFWLATNQPREAAGRLLQWAESVLRRLKAILGEAVSEGLCGRIPILLLHSLDAYYDYVSSYCSAGNHALSGGVYLNRGYGHFAFAFLEMREAESVVSHELTHALLSARPIPIWLNEGTAQLCQIAITGRDRTRYEQIEKTIGSYWTVSSIQEFWSGAGFDRQDHGQMHCYHLAVCLARKLATNAKSFRAFLKDAHWRDGGEAALNRHFGFGLGDLVSDYLGEGDWSPKGSAGMHKQTSVTVTLRAGARFAPAAKVPPG